MEDYKDLLEGIEIVTWDVDGTLYDHKAFRRKLYWMWFLRIYSSKTRAQVKAIANFHKWVAQCHKNSGDFVSSYDQSLRQFVGDAENHWFPKAMKKTKPKAGAIEYRAFQGKKIPSLWSLTLLLKRNYRH